jgi:hypothetical protein
VIEEDGVTEAELPLRLLVALAMSRPLAEPVVAVEALRAAIEDVVLPATFVDFDWHTSVITPADDLERGLGLTAPSRDWDLLRAAAAELESGGVGARRQDVPRDLLPPEPRRAGSSRRGSGSAPTPAS